MTQTPKLFWPAVIVGWGIIAVGIVGVLGEGRDVPPFQLASWIVGLALLHDLVLVPIVVAVGFGLGRLLPPPWRSVAGGALVVAGPVVLFAWPYVQRWGISSSNPSIQPRDYTHGLVVVLAVIAAASVLAAVTLVVQRARTH